MYEWERRECISVKQLEAIKELLEKQMYKKIELPQQSIKFEIMYIKK